MARASPGVSRTSAGSAMPGRCARAEFSRSSAILADRELGNLPRRHCAFRSRQRRSDERTMDGTFFGRRATGLTFGRLDCRLRSYWRRWRHDRLTRQEPTGRRLRFLIGTNGGRGGTFARTCQNLLVESRWRVPLLALRRCFRALVFVLRIARGAARLLHLGTDHGDNSVIGHAALTGTVIVQNVTKPKLALLHQIPRRQVWLEKKARGHEV